MLKTAAITLTAFCYGVAIYAVLLTCVQPRLAFAPVSAPVVSPCPSAKPVQVAAYCRALPGGRDGQ